MSSDIDVRSARTGGRAVVDVLADAFADDPWLRWALPDPAAVRSLMSVFLRVVAGPHGHVLVAREHQRLVGAAIVLPPDVEAALDPEVGRLVIQLHGRHAGRALDADAVLDRRRAATGAWVLHTLGVRRDARGLGAGGALLDAVLGLAQHSAVVVETASPTARDLYLRRGFTITETVDLSSGHGLGPDAPTVWMLVHHPAPGGC